MSTHHDRTHADKTAPIPPGLEQPAKAGPQDTPFTFYEFFAGGGTARLGLGAGWTCLMANDFDRLKAATYRSNFDGGAELLEGDVRDIRASSLPSPADLAWASFPCRDLSSAGARKGLEGASSGAFWPFWAIMRRLAAEGRAPGVIVLENVVGFLSSGKGRDFGKVAGAMAAAGYRVGALVADATLHLPHSRKRVFVVAVRGGVPVPGTLVGEEPSKDWTPPALIAAVQAMAPAVRAAWVWWRMPLPVCVPPAFEALLDADDAVKWHRPDETEGLLAMAGHHDSGRLQAARMSAVPVYGAMTVRSRGDEPGGKVRRANFAFGGPQPCILMPQTGMPRAIVIRVEGDAVRTRALTSAEGARFMGLPAGYRLPGAHFDAFRILGDAIAVPVVAHLARTLLEPLAGAVRASGTTVASWRPGTEAHGGAPTQRAPERARGASGPGGSRARLDGRVPGKGIKAMTSATTVYLRPDELVRVRRLALDRGISLHTLMQDGLDGELAIAGMSPLERYSAENRVKPGKPTDALTGEATRRTGSKVPAVRRPRRR